MNWIILPLVGAVIGWITNLLAVKMLFRPRREIRILGFTVQGLLPRRRREFAESIASTIETQLVSAEDIRSMLADPQLLTLLRAKADEKLAAGLLQKIHSLHPMAAMVVSAAMVDKLRAPLLDELFAELPGILQEGEALIASKLDLRARVVQKIEAFEMQKLESLILGVASRELVAIEYLGGVLGLLIGLAQQVALSVFA